MGNLRPTCARLTWLNDANPRRYWVLEGLYSAYQSVCARDWGLEGDDLGRKFWRLVGVDPASNASVHPSLQLDPAAAHGGLSAALGLNAAVAAPVGALAIEGFTHEHAPKAATANVVRDHPALHRLASWAQNNLACRIAAGGVELNANTTRLLLSRRMATISSSVSTVWRRRIVRTSPPCR